jgi:hypothetical protein
MTSSEIKNIIYNFLDLTNGKPVKSFDQNSYWWKRKNPNKINYLSKQIYNDIENNYYKKEQFIFYLFINYIAEGTQGIYRINHNDIKRTISGITRKQFEKDEEFLMEVMKKENLKVDDLFKVRENGESLIFKLIREKLVSVSYILQNYKKFALSTKTEEVELSAEYKWFCTLLLKTIKLIQKNI